jgi:hypothetical protein
MAQRGMIPWVLPAGTVGKRSSGRVVRALVVWETS